MTDFFNGQSGQKVAVIGSGVSGLGAAWLLSQRYEVTVFEQAQQWGGHVNDLSPEKRTPKVG